MDIVEKVARAIVGSARYDALPERATYLQRKSNSGAEWHDRAEARSTAEDAIAAYTEPTAGAEAELRALVDRASDEFVSG